jgi:hypothetical protein
LVALRIKINGSDGRTDPRIPPDVPPLDVRKQNDALSRNVAASAPGKRGFSPALLISMWPDGLS